jgi:hypothetical protein
MPTVRRPGQTNQRSYQTLDQIERTHRPSFARDDISQAYAGDENSGPFGDQKASTEHSTNVKSRKTAKSREKTPKR